MSTKLEELEQQARALNAEERAKLAEMLLESLREGPTIVDIEAAWEHEIRERVAAHDRGELQTVSAQDLFAEARQLAK